MAYVQGKDAVDETEDRAGGRARPAMPLRARRQLASTRRRFHSEVIDRVGELP